jgi:hypothetical protein
MKLDRCRRCGVAIPRPGRFRTFWCSDSCRKGYTKPRGDRDLTPEQIERIMARRLKQIKAEKLYSLDPWHTRSNYMVNPYWE